MTAFCRYAIQAIAMVTLLAWNGPASADEQDLWWALAAPGHVAIMRHALAPGTGDPANFDINRCDTQRNLSDGGRQQAARIGARFRDNGIERADVFTSGWCRCRETAELLELGPAENLPIINSFFREPERRGKQTRALTDWLSERQLTRPTVLVTHQVNITALTDIFPASGEIVVLRRTGQGRLAVLGTIETD